MPSSATPSLGRGPGLSVYKIGPNPSQHDIFGAHVNPARLTQHFPFKNELLSDADHKIEN